MQFKKPHQLTSVHSEHGHEIYVTMETVVLANIEFDGLIDGNRKSQVDIFKYLPYFVEL